MIFLGRVIMRMLSVWSFVECGALRSLAVYVQKLILVSGSVLPLRK